jgi:hypothetical protein
MIKLPWAIFLIFFNLLAGCALSLDEPSWEPVPEGQVVIFIYRKVTFAGGGRPHILRLDNRDIGPLTDTNYFRIELWPGDYFLSVYLPPENFFGQTKPARSISRKVSLDFRQIGRILVYCYEDGEATINALGELSREQNRIMKERSVTRRLFARDTAHLTSFMDTRYDGPEKFGKPHGRGVLTWPDGSRYEGVFDHGHMTNEGKFFFRDGNVFMGKLHKGRPVDSGVLFSAKGKILFTGPFMNETPHGTGIRVGEHGAEFCTFENGIDITQSFDQLAEEILEDQERNRTAAQLNEGPPESVSDSPTTRDGADRENKLLQILPSKEENRYQRLLAIKKKLMKEHQTNIDHEKAWCDDERSQGRNWCICAPFDTEANQRSACMP